MAVLEPREVIRRLTAWRDMHASMKLKEIATELGIEPGVYSTFINAYEVDENTIDELIEEWHDKMAEDDQLLREVVEANKNHKTRAHAARSMDIGYSRFGALLRRAADRGLDGSTPEPVPIGQTVKGLSTLWVTDPETGETTKRMDWVKTQQDPDRKRTQILEAWGDEIRRLTVPHRPVEMLPHAMQADLLNHYAISDAHLGSLAVESETGNTWKLKEAERVVKACFDLMIQQAPPAQTAVVCFLGDTQDYDGLVSETTLSGHVLDSDSRFGEIVRATVRVQKHTIHRALEHHEVVYFLDAEGNHDQASSVIRRTLWEEVYSKEPRLTVIQADLPYYAMNFGHVFLGWHHGHLAPKEKLNEIFADEFPVEWSIAGKDTKRYIHFGHLHRSIEPGETRGADLIQHATLAGRNAYAARKGLRSMRRARCHTYHRIYGDVGYKTVSPEMVSVLAAQ